MVRLSQKLKLIKLSQKELRRMTGYSRSRCDVLALYLYGSYGTPYQTPLSDIDLALIPVPGVRWTPQIFQEIVLELLAGKAESDDFNVVNLGNVPVSLQFSILETGRPLYIRDEILLADFKEIVVKRHADFAPDLRAISRDFDAALRGEFL